MGKCPHCGSRNIRRRYRQHRRYNWRCRRCNQVFRRPKWNAWLWIGTVAVIVMVVAAYALLQNIIPVPPTPIQVDESVDKVVKAVMYTVTPEVSTTQVSAQAETQVTSPMAMATPSAQALAPKVADTPTLTATAERLATSATTPESTHAPTSTPLPTFSPSPTYTSVQTRTATPRPTSTPRPTRTPTPTQIPGRSDLYNSFPLPQGLAYVWWYWEDDVRGFQSIDFDFTIHNGITVRELPKDSDFYLILFMSDISGAGYYFGIQTDVSDPAVGGRGRGCIFSRWETRDLANVHVAKGGWSESAGYEGNFVSVRNSFQWDAGDYRARIAADGDDDIGRWFGLWITNKASGETTWCGSLRFDKFATLQPSGGTVPEIYGSGAKKPIDVPEWHITLQRPVGDEKSPSNEAYITYNDAIPNSNIVPDAETGIMHIYVGGATERTTEEGWISLDMNR